MKTNAARHCIAALAACLAVETAMAGEQVLLDFGDAFDIGRVVATDAKASRSEGGRALRIQTGHGAPWPGVTFRAPAGGWDLSAFGEIAIRVRDLGDEKVTVYCRVDNDGADGKDHCVTGSAAVAPGSPGLLAVPLNRASDDRLGGKLFGMRGYPVRAGGPGTVDPSRITQLLVFVSKPSTDHQFEIGAVRARGAYTAPTAWTSDAEPFFPFIDAFGQYRHKEWPGKVRSRADLEARRGQEQADLAAHPGPHGWDRYGGWAAGPELKATGFFRTEKVNGKWWLVDPDGRLFFSHGIDCVLSMDFTPIEERKNWFENYPEDVPEFAQFLSHGYALKGHYAGRTVRCFCFGGANLLTKYGPGWRQATRDVVHQRLRSWGINTIGNWSEEAARLMRRTPYTDSLGSDGARLIEGSEGYWGKFPDVFDASFSAALQTGMKAKQGKSAGDPWCIGYFSDNEMSWGDELSLALAALKSRPDQPAKEHFMADLKAKYGQGRSPEAALERLNQVWGTDYTSWDALARSRQAPDKAKAREDLEAFYTQAAERYFRSVREAIKTAAPNQLYLGCRFAAVNARAAAAAAKYCDVVSYNLYQRSVANFHFNGGADVPLLIGEFHFGALDRGMFHTGLVPVADQRARAGAYKDYVLGAARHPQFVGCHWFQYMDEPVTGRVYDEENYQIGFVDGADTPYAETISACREAAEALYR